MCIMRIYIQINQIRQIDRCTEMTRFFFKINVCKYGITMLACKKGGAPQVIATCLVWLKMDTVSFRKYIHTRLYQCSFYILVLFGSSPFVCLLPQVFAMFEGFYTMQCGALQLPDLVYNSNNKGSTIDQILYIQFMVNNRNYQGIIGDHNGNIMQG